MSWPKGIPKTRADRGLELANIWQHIKTFTTEVEREAIGVSEDRAPHLNVMRVLDFLTDKLEP